MPNLKGHYGSVTGNMVHSVQMYNMVQQDNTGCHTLTPPPLWNSPLYSLICIFKIKIHCYLLVSFSVFSFLFCFFHFFLSFFLILFFLNFSPPSTCEHPRLQPEVSETRHCNKLPTLLYQKLQEQNYIVQLQLFSVSAGNQVPTLHLHLAIKYHKNKKLWLMHQYCWQQQILILKYWQT